MQSISVENLNSYFAKLLKKVPEERTAMFEELSQELLTDLRRRIGGAGKVQMWQDKYTGSGGGWAAVRPKAKTWTEATQSGKRYAVGHVTNAITSGHRTVNGGYVPGKGFYADANAGAKAIVERAMARFEARIKDAMEGGGTT